MLGSSAVRNLVRHDTAIACIAMRAHSVMREKVSLRLRLSDQVTRRGVNGRRTIGGLGFGFPRSGGIREREPSDDLCASQTLEIVKILNISDTLKIYD